MYEIASLKSKKLSELQEIAKSVGVRRLTGLKKMELIYQIIDTVAASPLEVNDNQPPIKGNIDSVAQVFPQLLIWGFHALNFHRPFYLALFVH